MRRGSIDRSRVKHVLQHELDTANRLAELGYDVIFRPPEGVSTADVIVIGREILPVSGRQIWELKSPTGFGVNTVFNLLAKSDRQRQCDRVLVDLARTPMSHNEAKRQVDRFLSTYSGAIQHVWIISEEGQSFLRKETHHVE